MSSCHTHFRSCPISARCNVEDEHLQTWFCLTELAPVATTQGSDTQACHRLSTANLAKCPANRCLQERYRVTGPALKTLAGSCPRRAVNFSQRSGTASFGLRRKPAIWLSKRVSADLQAFISPRGSTFSCEFCLNQIQGLHAKASQQSAIMISGDALLCEKEENVVGDL